jgi:hypothetical protein
MARAALAERERRRVGPRQTPAECPRPVFWDGELMAPMDNRMVWRHVLDGGEVPRRLRPMVLAYFGCLHGTGCVERGLGRDQRAVVEPHVGSLRPRPEVEEENSKCLEVHRDGPRREEDLFVRPEGSDVLLLTPFSRACAVQWLQKHGRRFGSRRELQKNKGVAAKRELGQHSDQALRRGIHSCYAEIARQALSSKSAAADASTLGAAQASRPTMLGMSRCDLQRSICHVPESGAKSKGTKNYQEHTKRKVADKEKKTAASGVWGGWTFDKPVMRLGGAAAVRAASLSAATQGSQARRWLGRRQCHVGRGAVKAVVDKAILSQTRRSTQTSRSGSRSDWPLSAGGSALKSVGSSASGSDRPRNVSELPSLQMMLAETALAVKTRFDRGGVCDEDLRKWITAVAFGKVVIVINDDGPFERFRLKPALAHAHDMCFTQKFARAHHILVEITQTIAAAQKSKWSVHVTAPLKNGPLTRQVREINNSESFVRMINAAMVIDKP